MKKSMSAGCWLLVADAESGTSISGPVDKETLAETMPLGSAGNSEAALLLFTS